MSGTKHQGLRTPIAKCLASSEILKNLTVLELEGHYFEDGVQAIVSPIMQI